MLHTVGVGPRQVPLWEHRGLCRNKMLLPTPLIYIARSFSRCLQDNSLLMTPPISLGFNKDNKLLKEARLLKVWLEAGVQQLNCNSMGSSLPLQSMERSLLEC